MINRFKFDHEKVVVVGDIHGQFMPLHYEINKRKELKNTLVIQLGDFGMGFTKTGYYLTILQTLNEHMKKNNNVVVALRGNHDAPEFFNGDFNYSNIKLVPDYSLLDTKVGNILVIGGAASIDLDHRIEGKTWWKDELPVYNIDALRELEKVSNIDYIVAHSNPAFCYPKDKAQDRGWNISDKAQAWSDKSRKTLSNIYDYVSNFHNVKGWFNGHYHWTMTENIKGTYFDSLSIMEIKELIYEVDKKEQTGEENSEIKRDNS